MSAIPTVACPRCGSQVHQQRGRCHNCGLTLTPDGPARAPLAGTSAGSRKSGRSDK